MSVTGELGISNNQKAVLEAIFQAGWVEGIWPKFGILRRPLRRKGVDVTASLQGLIPLYVHRDSMGPNFQDEESLRLTVRGINELSRRDSVIPVYLQVLNFLVSIESSYEPTTEQMQPTVTEAAVADYLAGNRPSKQAKELAFRLGLLIFEESGILSGGVRRSIDGRNWSITLSESIQRFEGVVSIDEYFAKSPLNASEQSTSITPINGAQAAITNLTEEDVVDPHKVFIVHGRDMEAHGAITDFVRALGLDPIEWNELVRATGVATPYTGDVVAQAFKLAHANIVLFTPDDIAFLHSDFHEVGDSESERLPTGQVRPNVLIEAGMALAMQRKRTVIVEIGTTRPISDMAGLNTVRITNTDSLKALAQRLEDAGCPVTRANDWLSMARFKDLTAMQRLPPASTVSQGSPPSIPNPRIEGEEREQAILVSAWADVEKFSDMVSGDSFGLVAIAQNGSNQPIYDVACTWSIKDLNGTQYFSVANLRTGLIPPSSPYNWRLDNEKFLDNIHPESHKVPSLENASDVVQRSRIAIAFADAEHRRWIRGFDGRLSRVEEEHT